MLAAPAGLIGVIGIDPGFRTGCKVAVVDETGKLLEHATIYPGEPKKDLPGAELTLYRLVQKHNVRAIAIGNGTASRETDVFVRNFLRKYQSGKSFELLADNHQNKTSGETLSGTINEPMGSPASSVSRSWISSNFVTRR